MGLLSSLFFGVLPAGVLGFIFYKIDKEKESIKSLLLASLFGVIAAFATSLLETLFSFLSGATFIYYIFVVALSEEIFKDLAAYLAIFNKKVIDHKFDLVVYFIFAALGLAAIENVFYLVGKDGWVALLRAFISVPGHACYCAIAGMFFEKALIARQKNDMSSVKKECLKAIGIPVLLHGIYDSITAKIAYAYVLGNATTATVIGLYIVSFIVNVTIIVFILKKAKESNESLGNIDLSLPFIKKNASNLQQTNVGELTGTVQSNAVQQPVVDNSSPSLNSQKVEEFMAFCPNCGNAGNTSFCTKCGTNLKRNG